MAISSDRLWGQPEFWRIAATFRLELRVSSLGERKQMHFYSRQPEFSYFAALEIDKTRICVARHKAGHAADKLRSCQGRPRPTEIHSKFGTSAVNQCWNISPRQPEF